MNKIANRFKKTALLLTTASMLAAPAYSFAEDGAKTTDCQHMQQHNAKQAKKMGKFSPRKELKMMARHLDLTNEQKSEIKTIFKTAKTNANVNKQAMKNFKKEVKALVHADTFDEQAFINLHTANQVQIQNMALAKAKVKHQVFNVLTPEQQEKWQNFKEKKRAKMQQRMLSNS